MTTGDEQGRSTGPAEPATDTEPITAAEPATGGEPATESQATPGAETTAGSEPGTDARSADRQPPAEHATEPIAVHGQPAPIGPLAIVGPPRRWADRWRGSRPLRVGAAVLAVVVIGGIGFGAGLAAGGHGEHRHGDGRHAADHRFHPGALPWMYRFEHGSRDDRPRAERPAPQQQPSPGTVAPAPTH
ncbi:hypothetical protein [Nocardia sp. BMG111209]|uniref:hypothetical protein n=1 Tax=Nocardia sp. BMG111209 TaxID=1160137 RepID=UPI000365ED0A|nr:hypothetical protein [Nocardia sp. BMG111209]